MTNFQKLSFFIWLLTLIVFFAGLLLMSSSSETTTSEFWSIVLLVDFLVGVLAFLAMFSPIFRSLLSKMIASLSVFQKLAHHIKKNPLHFFVLFLAFILFLWFQLRPSQIKAECQMRADEFSQRMVTKNLIKEITQLHKTADYVYKDCLHRNGL